MGSSVVIRGSRGQEQRQATRRRRRRGSVLILTVALVVLLALLGTAYLSTTSTDRAASSQDAANTEGDLQVQGLVAAVNASVMARAFGHVPAGTAYRPPAQEMPTYDGTGGYDAAGNPLTTTAAAGSPAFAAPTGYDPCDAIETDPFLGRRVPTVDANGLPTWGPVGWSPFVNSAQERGVDSPLDASATTAAGRVASLPVAYRPFVQCYPTTKVGGDGRTYPAVLLYLSGVPAAYATSTTYPTATGYLTPSGFVAGTAPTAATLATAAYVCFAANASGDGIADGVFFELPGGPVNGVTYYGAVRVVDGNSAVNASTAWTSAADHDASDGTASTNYGFFRSNVGLQELLRLGDGVAPAAKMAALNAVRFDGAATAPITPVNDDGTARTDYAYASVGDAMDHQSAGRPDSPGYVTAGLTRFQWLGPTATATLAHRFSLYDPCLGYSPLEAALPFDLTPKSSVSTVPSAPYPAAGVAQWYANQFAFDAPAVASPTVNPLTNEMPLRSLLVGQNAVSNAVSPRFRNVDGGPPAWAAGTAYRFGDWVIDGQRSYVCICQHTATAATEPTGVSPAATPFWAGAQLTAQAVSPGVPWTRQPVKTSANTAPFDQLWLAFAQVMCDSVGPDAATAGGAVPQATAVPQWQPPMRPIAVVASVPDPYPEQQMPQFRSCLRDPNGGAARRLTSSQMLKLRAALAAVNTIDLRDGDDDVTSRRVILTDAAGMPAFDAEVFGTEAQPFIGAVYAHVDPITAANTFLAIQFVNPYDHAITVDPSKGWRLGIVNRSTLAATSSMAQLTMTDVTAAVGFTTAFTVPAKSTATGAPGLAVIQSGTTPPAGYTTPATVTTVAGLQRVLTSTPGELYLMRPRLAAGPSVRSNTTPYPVGPFGEAYDESGDISDLVPVDQVDLTNLPALAAATPNKVGDFYYRRGSDPAAAAGWNFVFPGLYIGPNASTPYASVLPQGFGSDYQTAPVAGVNPLMGQPYGYAGVTGPDTTGTTTPTAPTYHTYPVVLNNTYMAGPNRLRPSNGSGSVPAYPASPRFPFGGFARNGDLLQIPFIGAYRVRAIHADGTPVSAASFLEINSVSEDSSLATDTTLADTGRARPTDSATTQYTEQIGRFCPVGDAAKPGLPASFDFGRAYGNWHYHWAKRLPDYLTVQSPADDYAPDVDPAPADAAITLASGPGTPTVAKYDPLAAPVPVANTPTGHANAQVAGTSEDTRGVEGLVNINTAPWPVLAALPIVPAGTDHLTYVAATTAGGTGTATAVADGVDDRIQLAKAIVEDRTANGPFRSVLDLYRVPAFRLENDALLTTEPGAAQGVFSPAGMNPLNAAPTGRPRFDFQERFLLADRISNLVTVRSDNFACYVVVQGYRDVGVVGATPTLVQQRRAAYLLDRSGITPASRDVPHFTIGQN